MEKIDRLGWAGGICIKSHGWRIGVRTNQADENTLQRMMRCLPPAWEPAEPPFVDMLYSLRLGGGSGRVRNYHLLFAPLEKAARTMDREELFEALDREVQRFVSNHALERIFVRAGVVGWKGRAIVL